jgi:hypothetical protein
MWKLLYDASRFPDWWEGVETVQEGEDGPTFYPDGYPDFPMPQQMETSRQGVRVKVSCLVSDIRFEWRLADEDGGTRISVEVEIPDEEAHQLERQREVASASLRNLATLAAGA